MKKKHSVYLICNLQCKEKNYISIIPQNASTSDNHLIIPSIEKILKDCDFLSITKSAEKYIFYKIKKYLEKKILVVRFTRKVMR